MAAEAEAAREARAKVIAAEGDQLIGLHFYSILYLTFNFYAMKFR